MRKLKHGRSTKLAFSLIAIGVLGLAAIWVVYARRPIPPSSSGSKSVATDQAPSSTKPTAKTISGYSVAPTLPKYISIPDIGIGRSRVISLGLLSDGHIAAPSNIYDTGWYDGSTKPGQPGAMFIYGHVSGRPVGGIFHDLNNLKPGDHILITRGDNHTYTYQVVGAKAYPSDKVDMGAVLSPVNPDKPGLNLMTCDGQIIPGTREFDERLVVFTSLVES